MKQNKFLIILLTAITLCSCSNNNSNISSNNSQNISDKYTIYFDTDGGSPINLITQDYGTIVELPTPTKDGYKFVGWIHNNKFISEKFILLKSDIKLTAYWIDENLEFAINNDQTTLTITRCDKSITSITIPSSVTEIGEYAFGSCTSLTNITISSSVTTIGYGAFGSCTSLINITIPSTVNEIGYGTFSGCTSLENVYYEGTIEDWCNIKFSNYSSNPMQCAKHFYMLNNNNGYEEVTSIEIPDTVTSVGDYQFNYFSNVTSITIPSSVTTIGRDAFLGCTSLTNINLPNSVTAIENGAFLGCASLTNITFPNSVTTIGESAFRECISLASVIIPSSVTAIGKYAFCYCRSLTIYCEVTSQPSGWSLVWADSNCTVVWDYKNK